jgi:hypothetical protein
MEKIHNMCAALNVIEKIRPSKNEHRIIDLKTGMYGNVRVEMTEYFFVAEQVLVKYSRIGKMWRTSLLTVIIYTAEDAFNTYS